MFSGCGGLTVPKPAFETVAQEPDQPLEASELDIPVTVHLGPILQKVEETVPREFASNGWETIGTSPAGDVGVNYFLWRDPLNVAFAGDRVSITVHVRYTLAVAHRLKSGLLAGGEAPWMEFGRCGGEGEAPREVVFGIETSLRWSPEWKVISHSVMLPNVYPNACSVTALNFDITRAIDDQMRPLLKEVAALIDERIPAEADFKKTAAAAWKQAQQPLELDKDLWLLPNPRGIHVNPIRGAGHRIDTGIGIVSQPVLLGGKKPVPEIVPLPPLQVGSKGSGAFRVALKAQLGFDVAAAQLLKRLGEKPMVFGKREVAVTAVAIYPSKEKCVIQLGLKGAVDGTIYFIGEPVYDRENKLLTFKNLNYSLETQNVLHAAAEWLLHDDFRAALRKNAQWRMDTELADAKAKIEKALNTPLDEHTTLAATVDEQTLRHFYMSQTAFKAEVVAQGTAAVIWK